SARCVALDILGGLPSQFVGGSLVGRSRESGHPTRNLPRYPRATGVLGYRRTGSREFARSVAFSTRSRSIPHWIIFVGRVVFLAAQRRPLVLTTRKCSANIFDLGRPIERPTQYRHPRSSPIAMAPQVVTRARPSGSHRCGAGGPGTARTACLASHHLWGSRCRSSTTLRSCAEMMLR